MAGLYSAAPRGLASSCLADRHQNFYDPHVISRGKRGGGGGGGDFESVTRRAGNTPAARFLRSNVALE